MAVNLRKCLDRALEGETRSRTFDSLCRKEYLEKVLEGQRKGVVPVKAHGRVIFFFILLLLTLGPYVALSQE